MRPIDADALRDAMFHYYGCVNTGTDKSNYKGETLMNYEVADLIDDCISTAPTIEAEPVRHGHWINHKDEHTCSVCEMVVTMESYNWDDDGLSYDYCPYCGARMVGNK